MKPAWGWGRIATVEKAGKDLEIRVGVAVGMEEMGALLGRWRMDEAEMRRRMYRAPTLRERERWHAVWLLAQGWTMGALLGRWRMDEAEMRRRMYRAPTLRERERQRWTAAVPMRYDAHTIGLWARAFAEGGPKAMVFEQSGGSPPCWTWSTGRVEGGGAGVSIASRNRPIQLELEGGATLLLCHRFGFAIFSRDSSD